MAIAERARKSDTAPQAVSPTTATIIERLNTMDACDLDAPPALNLTIAPKEMYSQHKKCSAFSLDDSFCCRSERGVHCERMQSGETCVRGKEGCY